MYVCVYTLCQFLWHFLILSVGQGAILPSNFTHEKQNKVGQIYGHCSSSFEADSQLQLLYRFKFVQIPIKYTRLRRVMQTKCYYYPFIRCNTFVSSFIAFRGFHSLKSWKEWKAKQREKVRVTHCSDWEIYHFSSQVLVDVLARKNCTYIMAVAVYPFSRLPFLPKFFQFLDFPDHNIGTHKTHVMICNLCYADIGVAFLYIPQTSKNI